MTSIVLKDIPVEFLKRGKFQPRCDFDPVRLEELAKSIRQSGVIQPIIVRELAENDYEIIAGERRWRAAQLAKLATVPALVRDLTEEEAATLTTVENIQRQDLNPIEEAQSYRRLVQDFGYHHDDVAEIVGKSRSKITNSIRLLNLDERVQRLMKDGKLSEGHGKVLGSTSAQWQYILAKQSIEKEWSVRSLEKQIQLIKLNNNTKPPTKDVDVARLEQAISEQLAAEVKLDTDADQQSGWMKVRFNSNEILEGILERLSLSVDK